MAQTKVYISQDYCIACGLCREVCPVGTIHPKFQDFHHWFEVVADACTGEGTCLEYCPAPSALVQTAESIRTGTAQDMVDFANLTPVQAETFFRTSILVISLLVAIW